MAGDRDLLASDEDGARKMLFGGADLGRVAGIAGRMLLAWMKIGKMLWPDPMVRGCCWNTMTGRWVWDHVRRASGSRCLIFVLAWASVAA
ncbi:hypothetical protein ACLOJK_036743 [Asimina triloba]